MAKTDMHGTFRLSVPVALAVLWSPVPALAQPGPQPASGAAEASMAADTPGPGAANESVRRTRGFESGLRLGVAVPFGESTNGRDLSDEVSFRAPIWLDIGYRLSKPVYLALYAQAGLVNTAMANCVRVTGRQNASCSADDLRVGVEVLVNPAPRASLDFWVGAGVAWERFRHGARFLLDVDASLFGDELPPEFQEAGIQQVAIEVEELQSGPVLDLQAGVDFDVAGSLQAGPFVGYSLGTYIMRSVDVGRGGGLRDAGVEPSRICPGCGEDGALDQTGLHHWAALGLRGTFGP